jgi:DsbC/DsbD-like thiol-disulfide interchange protein
MNKLGYLLLLPLISAGTRDTAPPNYGEAAVPTRTSFAPARGMSLRPVRWSLVGGDRVREVTSGRTVPVTVQAEIAKGWHIYSLSQKPGGPIPLRLRLTGAADIVIRGVVRAPKPERTFDKNFGIETELYSGTPRFTIPVGVPARSIRGIRKLHVAARYQVCSDKLCLPPRTDTVGVTLRVAAPK